MVMVLIAVALVLTSVLVVKLTWTRTRPTAESFLVANRSVPLGLGAATLTANWIQAPAMLASGALAYAGPYHFAAFVVPNVLALVLMGILAPHIQRRIRRGYTIPQVAGEVFGPHVRTLFFISAIATLSVAVAYTFTGLRLWLTQQLGVSSLEIALMLGLAAAIWVLPLGLPGAIVGDTVKISLVAIGTIGACLLFGLKSGTAPMVAPQTLAPEWIFWSVGVTLAASLLGGPILNPDLGERVFAIEGKVVRRAYFWAAALFGCGVLGFGSLGFLARSMSLPGGQIPAFAVIQALLPMPAIVLISVGLVVVLTAALASLLASAGDLVGIEVLRRLRPEATDSEIINWSRCSMLVPIAIGTYLSSLETVDITVLLQSMAVIRGEAIFPLILALFWPRPELHRVMAFGIIVAACVGIALTFGASWYESIVGAKSSFLIAHGKPLGALFAVFFPLVAYVIAAASIKKLHTVAA